MPRKVQLLATFSDNAHHCRRRHEALQLAHANDGRLRPEAD